MQLKPGAQLQNGKYVILRTLGQGGFGITYEAEQVLLHRKVALKEFFMKDCCERDESTSRVTVGTGTQRALVEKFRGKFLREAQMMAGMSNAHIVRVHDVFEENGTAYYVMENLPGGSLKGKIDMEGPLSEAEAEKYIRQVASALSYIHGLNTVHLDVKPSNILLNADGEAVLIDFGISKHYDSSGEQTSSTPVGISKGYAPLEQGRDGDVSQFKPSTDIYALGATLYNLVSGQVPPEASLAAEEGIPRPSGLSDRLWRTISESMKPFRKDRPQSIAEFLALLDAPVATPLEEDDTEEVTKIKEEERTRPAASQGTSKPSRSTKASVTPASESLAPAPKPKKTWLWALLGAIALAALLAVIFFDGHTPSGQTKGSINGHEWVDLGLPSGLKWATMNVGASSPSDYGSYFAWGETSPKTDYTWEKYRFRVTGDSYDNVTFSKYNTRSEYGTVDNKKRLDRADDAARMNWGGSWRMPTDAEWKELSTQCDWNWTSLSGKDGYKVTSKTNGNHIFLPAAGGRYGAYLDGVGSRGYYWSSSLDTVDPYNAWGVGFHSGSVYRSDNNRYYGRSVRPVSE